MPYIPREDRPRLVPPVLALSEHMTKAELCYTVATLMRMYAQYNRGWHGMSDAISAVECAKLDFYAMVVQPYEEQKKKANGDVP